ncbi:MAG: hypothetical protein PHC54_07500 [Candidatus Omnitrophica bacterium]|nr:hypothetical protein [Candidatus Omnitrophota bacterium]MDD5593081.1 hypothetical protein [Candidatus Omnitrophota bacterium]
MVKWLLSPPVAFLIILLVSWLLSRIFSRISFRAGKAAPGSGQPYACGEKNYDHMTQPDYSTFFPFAFFFTLAHVTTLIITSVPRETVETLAIAVIYITGAVIGLLILLRD